MENQALQMTKVGHTPQAGIILIGEPSPKSKS